MSGGELHSNLGRTRGGPVSQPGLIIAPNTLPMWATWNNCNYYYCRLATTTKATENGRTLPGDSIEFIQIRMTQFAHCDMAGGWCRWMDVPTFSLASLSLHSRCGTIQAAVSAVHPTTRNKMFNCHPVTTLSTSTTRERHTR